MMPRTTAVLEMQPRLLAVLGVRRLLQLMLAVAAGILAAAAGVAGMVDLIAVGLTREQISALVFGALSALRQAEGGLAQKLPSLPAQSPTTIQRVVQGIRNQSKVPAPVPGGKPPLICKP